MSAFGWLTPPEAEGAGWRGGRVVECGGLENRCAGNRTGGSNPLPSAIKYLQTILSTKPGARAPRFCGVFRWPRRIATRYRGALPARRERVFSEPLHFAYSIRKIIHLINQVFGTRTISQMKLAVISYSEFSPRYGRHHSAGVANPNLMRCSFQSCGMGLKRSSSVSCFGCRPSTSAWMISGASRLRRNTRAM